MDRLVIRPALSADADAVARLIREFSAEDGQASPITADEVIRHAFAASPRFAVLLAEEAGLAVGYVLYYPSYDTDHAARGFYLQDVYVRPGARGRGIGRALMVEVAHRCLEDHGRYLFWNALEGNAGGRAFYRAIGAREEPVVTLSLQPERMQALASKRIRER